MVNTNQFAGRLNKILDFYDLSAASFADKIEVGRSSISHILSGRNKPSLDFVMKVIKNFPEVELYWLLNGKGSFPSNQEATPPEVPSAPSENWKPEPPVSPQQLETKTTQATENFSGRIPEKNSKQIKKIVIFYEDGSFEAFEN